MKRHLRKLYSNPKIVQIITIINLAIYLMWLSSPYLGKAQVIHMQENFLISWDAINEERLWTLISSVFSHNMFFHFFLNMFILRGFGSVVEKTLGSWRFLKFYLSAGVVSSLAHAYTSYWLVGDPSLPALGASGAIAGTILIFSLLYPKEKILLFGIIPLPSIFGALLFVGLDIWGLISQASGHGLPIGHGAHLGGAFYGIFYYIFVIRRQRRMPSRAESD